MTSKIELNGSASVNYLIHGQDLSLTFNFPNAWFVCIHYNPVPTSAKFRKGSFWWFQRLHWFKRTGVFESKVNFFYPHLSLYIVGWGIKKINIPMSINNVHVKNDLPSFHLPKILKKTPHMTTVPLTSCQTISIPNFRKFERLQLFKKHNEIILPLMELEQRLIAKKIK